MQKKHILITQDGRKTPKQQNPNLSKTRHLLLKTTTQNQKSEKPSIFRSRLSWIINILEVVGEDGIQKSLSRGFSARGAGEFI